jgi:hypothetical protein
MKARSLIQQGKNRCESPPHWSRFRNTPDQVEVIVLGDAVVPILSIVAIGLVGSWERRDARISVMLLIHPKAARIHIVSKFY